MEATAQVELEPPHHEYLDTLLIAGFSEAYTAADGRRMPEQWQRFAPHIGHIDGQVGETTFGVLSGFGSETDSIDYMTGVQVSGSDRLPAGFSSVEIPAGDYQVFEHSGHVSTIQRTWHAIWQQWIPESGLQLNESSVMFEKYGEEFDPESGLGVIEIWIPRQ